ncbi:alpha/beta hydrolase [Magnetospirillum sp. UT-4]|uniref:alpha/beta hydrolase n=1 Tax=Magnetospirillum sp. UT-4 TaxID=2681467 RepID=UPI00137F388B|nr:alpha/beta hydrolase [Magnetospirillum sp. UT-4]CAA7623423.1 Lysophospholipase [Magnetospirillum sp. UT-4]
MAAPEMNGDHWLSPDRARLPLRSWLPAGRPKAVVLALHGMNDYSNFFDEPGKALAARGIAAYAYDQRGFGQGPHPGYWSGAEAMAADLRIAAGLVAAHHPGVPLYLLGESMGGAVAILATAGTPPPQVSGLILSAPAVWGRSSMGLVQRAALWLAYQLAPGWRLTGEGLRITPSDNIEMLRRLSADPLVIKATRVDAVKGLVDLMDEAAAAAPRLRLPTLVLYGAKDEIIPPDPTWAMAGALHRQGRTRIAYYPGGYHMLLRDLQAKVVLDDIAAWIADPAAPLPSGAEADAERELAARRR